MLNVLWVINDCEESSNEGLWSWLLTTNETVSLLRGKFFDDFNVGKVSCVNLYTLPDEPIEWDEFPIATNTIEIGSSDACTIVSTVSWIFRIAPLVKITTTK